jgi:hypothetical protein
MKLYLELKRTKPARQQRFPFYDRSQRRLRWFKLGVITLTGLAIAVILAALPKGRYLVASVPPLARQAVRSVLGLPTPREEIDAGWRRYRLSGVLDSKRAITRFYADADPAYQRLLRYAGMDPDHGLHRWGNYRLTVLLPSTVFEADDTGRSYRLRPCTQSIWLRELTLKAGVLMFFLVPDGPGLSEAMRGTSAIVVTESKQSTNAWGLRGPEPELDAPFRGIVLGDSYMQGMFIGDNDTPPECLRRDLQRRWKSKVSILNTGHLGYSPEQYYYSLVAFADRFVPHFVVVSIFANDFGDAFEVLKGKGDWDEGKYWLDRIGQFCRTRQLPFLVVPVPQTIQMMNRRMTGFYPGILTNILDISGLKFLDPTDAFVDAHLGLVIEGERKGQRPAGCPLFNEQYRDGHFSALGSEVWAEAVGRRIALLMPPNQ